jgi:hypothetical protein
MSISETATCGDCGLTVQYMDDGYWPWRGIDGNDMCRTQVTDTGNEVRFPHRISHAEAQEIFAAYKARTGREARHQ